MRRLGIIGGGQLGRMLAQAAIPLGVRCTVLEPGDAPAAAVAHQLKAEYGDQAAGAALAEASDAITYEFEHLPLAAVRAIAEQRPVLPDPRALAACQDRLVQKAFLSGLGIPTAPWAPLTNPDELAAAATVGRPIVLKTARDGYDGKGQRVVHDPARLAVAWQELGGTRCVAEGFVPFEREVSIVAVRGRDGDTACYPVVENRHTGGILRLTLAPAPGLTPALQDQAEDLARRMLDAFAYVGVLTVELFQVGDRLVVNELAPRVHNSGHWTIEGAECSQFENHVRAVLGLPLGSTATRGPAAMLNCIGTMPDAAAVLAVPGAHLHDYHKAPRAGRKLGHITVTAPDLVTLGGRLERLLAL